MGSVMASGIPVVPKKNVAVRRYGRNSIIGSGSNPYGVRSVELPTVKDTVPTTTFPSGTPSGTFYSTTHFSPAISVHRSDTDTQVSRNLTKVTLSSGNQPEINLKPVSQRFSFNNSNKIVTGDSSSDSVISRT